MAKKLNPLFNVLFTHFVFIFSPFFFYVWHVNEIIHIESVLMKLTGNEFLIIEKNCWQQNCTFFVSKNMWNLAFTIRWENLLVWNGSLRSYLDLIVFLVFRRLTFFHFLNFFLSVCFFFFSNFRYFKLLFQWFFKKQFNISWELPKFISFEIWWMFLECFVYATFINQ